MTDLTQAARGEALLFRSIPHVHVADTTIDKGYFLEEGAATHADAPEENWILRDLGERARTWAYDMRRFKFLVA